ncbi:MAG: nucleotidyltransferase family protein [Gammaproteobacteria bacterium]|nr:nucleotidyltransferase family protein [Gammaproteobacteria bacterium]
MKAMILAAGRGERMKPLTVITPKPLLMVGSTTLIAHCLHQLRDAGIKEVVINVHHLKDQIMDYCGDGSRFGLNIQYSIEEELLETGGGIFQALPLLGNDPFLLVSADVWTDYPLKELTRKCSQSAHLVFVYNPDFHPQGDYGLDKNGFVRTELPINYTYASFGVINPDLFRGEKHGVFRLTKVLQPAIQNGLVTGELYESGVWHNIGTIKELDVLRKEV